MYAKLSLTLWENFPTQITKEKLQNFKQYEATSNSMILCH